MYSGLVGYSTRTWLGGKTFARNRFRPFLQSLLRHFTVWYTVSQTPCD
jgi:hypothetical protein